MKLAFSTNAFTRFALPEALEAIRSAGFEGVEILADAPHAWPDAMDDAQIASLRRQLDRLNLCISNINANCSFAYWKHAPPEPYFEPSLISPDPELRRDRDRLIRRTIDMAQAIGAANISITTGRCLPGMPPQKAVGQLREALPPLLDYAGQRGIDVGIECEPGLFLEYAAELRQWIADLGHPRLGANLDVGHSQVLGESIPDAVRTLAGRIWNLHVEDIPGRKHYHMIPGQGTLDWRGLVTSLRQIGYDRYLTCELYTCVEDPHGAARASHAFLGELLRAV